MIVTLRGTNGAGKSTIVRQIIEMHSHVQIQYPLAENKRKPMGYLCNLLDGRRLFVPGHYQIQNGGVDTLPSLNYAYSLILNHHELGCSVLYEGKNLGDSMKRIHMMRGIGIDVRVIFIKLPLKACIAAVRKRGHEIAEETITKIYLKSLRDFEECQDLPHTYHLTRNEAQKKLLEWFA